MLHTLLLLAAVVDPAVAADGEWHADPAEVPVDVVVVAPALAPAPAPRAAPIATSDPVVVDNGGAVVMASACAGGLAVCSLPLGIPGVLVALALPAGVAGGSAVFAGKEPTTAIGVAVGAGLGTGVGALVGGVSGALVGFGSVSAVGARGNDTVGGFVVGGVIGAVAGGGAAIALALE